MTVPRATLRLQFHHAFTLDDAAALAPYFAQLGISHVYASPLTRARPGSTHGYDVIDYGCIDPQVGGEPALRRLVARLRQYHLGLILDIVPNHMAASHHNPWWTSVLQYGRHSPYALHVDIDWDSPGPMLQGRLLAPFLGRAYGHALEDGAIRLTLDADAGQFRLLVHDVPYPLAPASYAGILRAPGAAPPAALAALAARLEALDDAGAPDQGPALYAALAACAAQPAHADWLAAAVSAHDPGTDAGRARLHGLLERQHYRLAWWRVASDEINWRRFFEISDLAGLRAERQTVFEDTHALVLRLYGEGLIDGVRVDHVDGMTDPGTYCRLLRTRLRAAAGASTNGATPREPYIVVEKILAAGEALDERWELQGTSGYDFMNDVGGLLHDPAGAEPLSRLWQQVTQDTRSALDIVDDARRQLLTRHFAGEFELAARTLHAIALADPATRDWSLQAIRRVLTELLAAFPAYRTYAGPEGRSAADAARFAAARTVAYTRLLDDDRELLSLMDGWLGGEPPQEHPTQRDARLLAIRRFQQLTAPLAAKSVEDTTFYRYGRLLSRNEVGSDAGDFAWSPDDFHRNCLARAHRYPHGMLATATHDHKRGEDLRARLAVLSEIPQEWAAVVQTWRTQHAPLHRHIDGQRAPEDGDVLMLYQTLVGAWPLDLSVSDTAALEAFAARVVQWQIKAVREAKTQSGWFAPNEDYEAACRAFTLSLLSPGATDSAREVAACVARIAAAGAANGLSQMLLRLTVPGVPDLYQGTEFWDFSLTDPDNRRPVDFEARIAATADDPAPQTLLADWRDGRLKQALLRRTLATRTTYATLFADGDYLPLRVQGEHAQRVVAFARRLGDQAAVVVVPRLTQALRTASGADTDSPLVPPAQWGDTAVRLPPGLAAQGLRDVLSGRHHNAPDDLLPVAQALRTLPVALLVADAST